uniref:Uncharacterized protein n=1 Tax=Cannabis sativa TaxID=3483 RepID=A0A803NKQ2_CANSA
MQFTDDNLCRVGLMASCQRMYVDALFENDSWTMSLDKEKNGQSGTILASEEVSEDNNSSFDELDYSGEISMSLNQSSEDTNSESQAKIESSSHTKACVPEEAGGLAMTMSFLDEMATCTKRKKLSSNIRVPPSREVVLGLSSTISPPMKMSKNRSKANTAKIFSPSRDLRKEKEKVVIIHEDPPSSPVTASQEETDNAGSSAQAYANSRL